MRQLLLNRTGTALRGMPTLLLVMASVAWMQAGIMDARARPDDSEPAARNFNAGSLRTKAEELLMKSRDLARLKRYFSNHAPHSLNGRVALAWLRMKEGRRKEALRHLRLAWHSPDLGVAAERFVLSEMRGMLSGRDHEIRLWRLVTDQKTRAAVRTAGLLSTWPPPTPRAP